MRAERLRPQSRCVVRPDQTGGWGACAGLATARPRPRRRGRKATGRLCALRLPATVYCNCGGGLPTASCDRPATVFERWVVVCWRALRGSPSLACLGSNSFRSSARLSNQSRLWAAGTRNHPNAAPERTALLMLRPAAATRMCRGGFRRDSLRHCLRSASGFNFRPVHGAPGREKEGLQSLRGQGRPRRLTHGEGTRRAAPGTAARGGRRDPKSGLDSPARDGWPLGGRGAAERCVQRTD